MEILKNIYVLTLVASFTFGVVFGLLQVIQYLGLLKFIKADYPDFHSMFYSRKPASGFSRTFNQFNASVKKREYLDFKSEELTSRLDKYRKVLSVVTISQRILLACILILVIQPLFRWWMTAFGRKQSSGEKYLLILRSHIMSSCIKEIIMDT